MTRWFIYGLLRNGTVFYVGKTIHIHQRMLRHKRKFRKWHDFCILQSGVGRGWETAERRWIRKLRKQIINIMPGGEGITTEGAKAIAANPNSVRKIRVAIKNLWKQPEYRARMLKRERYRGPVTAKMRRHLHRLHTAKIGVPRPDSAAHLLKFMDSLTSEQKSAHARKARASVKNPKFPPKGIKPPCRLYLDSLSDARRSEIVRKGHETRRLNSIR